MSSLERSFACLFEWFSSNQINANLQKCDILMNVNRPATIKIGEHTTWNSYCKKCLVFKSIVNSILTNILKLLLKKNSCQLTRIHREAPAFSSFLTNPSQIWDCHGFLPDSLEIPQKAQRFLLDFLTHSLP